MYRLLLLMIMLLTSSAKNIFAQTVLPQKNIGVNLQWYPAGFIVSMHFEKFYNPQTALSFRIGGNFANRKDFSPYNENEKGNGLGAGIGYNRYFNFKKGKILLGADTDVWNMWIHWRNNIGQPNETNGTTYTLVLQPWIEAGYFYPVGKSPVQIGITTGFGREINVITNGKEVGQGWMNSLLLKINYTIK